jgi:hypothetical protein
MNAPTAPARPFEGGTFTALFLLLLLLLFGAGCQQKKDDPTTGFSDQINTIAPKALIDTLRKNGLIVHEGRVPPQFEGRYLFSRSILKSTNYPSYPVGTVFADYSYRFHGQNNSDLTVKLDYESIGGQDKALGTGAFVAGHGNRFTAFVQVKGTSNGVAYEALDVYSGEVTATGIRSFQKGFILNKKGPDPDDKLVPVGTYRIFDDEDGLSPSHSGFRQAAPAGRETLRNLLQR